MTKKYSAYWLVLLLCVACISILAGVSIGAANISMREVFNAVMLTGREPYLEQIVWQLRMPRTVLAFIAGGGLALSGLMLQTVTRNPLADPYLFGISSGAAMGVVLFIALSGAGVYQLAQVSLSLAAFVGSIVAMSLLLAISGSSVGRQVESMLLAGVALSFLFSAITSITLYWSDPQAITAVLFWTMGSFSRAQWLQLTSPSILLCLVLALLMIYRKQLTALLLGDESAITLGVNVRHFRQVMLLLSSLLTASIVAISGGIGFVGLMVPHVVRFLISQAHPLTPVLVCVFGGSFMVWVDVLARSVLHNQELPVGVITGIIGSVFFLFLMFMRQRKLQR